MCVYKEQMFPHSFLWNGLVLRIKGRLIYGRWVLVMELPFPQWPGKREGYSVLPHEIFQLHTLDWATWDLDWGHVENQTE